MEALAILVIFEIILFIFAVIYSNNDIMAPSVVFCIMFMISTATALINVDTWEFHFSIQSAVILGTGILTFVLGEIVFRRIFCGHFKNTFEYEECYSEDDYYVKPWKLDALILFDLMVCAWNLLCLAKITGVSLSHVSTIFIEYRRMRIDDLSSGNGTSIPTLLNQFLKIEVASGYVAGYLFANNLVLKNKRIMEQLKLLAVIVLSMIPGIMTGGRTSMLRLASAIIIEYYIIWHQKNGWDRNLSWKYIRYGIFGFVIAIPGFYYSLVLLGRNSNKTIFTYICDYLGSSIALFNSYVEFPIERKMWGEESLFSVVKILNYLGLSDLSTSYNLEFRSLVVARSNVYTFFRRPLHDFGLSGMYVFTLLIAFLFAWFYYSKIKYRKKSDCILWVLVYGYLYYWMICASIVQYSVNYISAGTVITVVMILILFKVMVTGALESREETEPVWKKVLLWARH